MNRTSASVLALSLSLSALTPMPGRADDLATAKAELEVQQLKSAIQAQDLENASKKQKLVTDALPASPTSGAITLGTDAGKLEAQGLSAAAINDLAARIVADVLAERGARPSPPLVLTTGVTALTFAEYDQFSFRAKVVEQSLDDAKSEGDAALKATTPKAPPKGSSTHALVGALGAVATAVNAGVKLVQLALPDWALGGVSVAEPSDRALAMAVARAYAGHGDIYWLEAVGRRDAGQEVFTTLTDLRSKAKAANQVNLEIANRLKTVKKPGDKARLTAAAADLTRSAEAYNALIGAMNGADAVLPIAKVIAQADVAKLLGDNGVVLNVTTRAAAGGYVTRKGLANVFQPNRIPVRVAGGAAADFALVDPKSQKVLTAGYHACQSDYVWLKHVAPRVNAQPKASTDTPSPRVCQAS